MKYFLSLLLLASTVQAQNITVAGPFSGLNNDNSSITIDPGEAQDTLNVEVSGDSLSLNKRKGYSLLSALEVATGSITGSAYFKTDSGDNIRLFAYDTFVDKSTNGGAFSHIYSTAIVGSKWSFCVSNGKAYAFNSSTLTPWSYDGTSVVYYPTMPMASLCSMTVDRMLLSGVASTPNRLYFSRSGTITDFTVDIEPEAPGFEDIGLPGEKITNIFATQAEWLVFKTNSMTSYQGTNQFDLVPSVISEKTGMSEPHAIVQNEGIVYFKSTDGKFYGYASGTLSELSKKISGFTVGITKDATNTQEYTNKSDFDGGTYYNTTGSVTAGSVEPLTYQNEDTSTADFNAGTKNNIMASAEQIELYEGVAYFDNMGVENGTLNSWTPQQGAFSVVSTDTPKYGTYQIHASNFDSSTGGETWLLMNGDNTLTAGGEGDFDIGESDFFDLSTAYISFMCSNNHTVKVIHSRSFDRGKFQLSVKKPCMIDVNEAYYSSGTFISRVHTVTAPVPHYGFLVSTQTKRSFEKIDLFVRRSSSTTGVFDGWQSTTDYLILSSSDIAWQWKADLYTSSPTLPNITGLSLLWKSTGYWESPEVSMGGMTSWGLFNANSTLDGLASMSYTIAVSSYLGGTATATRDVITPATLIAASMGEYSRVRATNDFRASTETARLNNLSYSWTRAPDGLANAFEYKSDIYFSVPYLNSFTNNRLLKLDIGSGGWNIFDIPLNSPLSIGEKVYFGSPTAGYLYDYPSGNSDNGASINSYWKTKNYIGTNPYVEKQFQKLSLIAGSDYGSTLDVSYTMDTTTSTSYSISLTSSPAGFVRNNRALPIGERGTFFNLQIGNNAVNQPWSLYGASIDYTDDPWRVIPEE